MESEGSATNNERIGIAWNLKLKIRTFMRIKTATALDE